MAMDVLYVILVIDAFIIGHIIKQHRLFDPFWNYLIKLFPNKKVVILIVSNVLGCMPIPGRITVAAPILKSYINNKNKLGVFNYLATHHYYFWSPIETSVIIILGGLSLTYGQFLYYIWPLLLVYIVFIVLYTLFVLKYSDINDFTDSLDINKSNYRAIIPPIAFGVCLGLSVVISPIIMFTILAVYYILLTNETISNCWKSINWKLVLFVGVIIIIANLIHENISLPDVDGYAIIGVLGFGFLFSFLMGSSSKYAGIVVAITLVLGIEYLPLVFAIEYAGYYLSPMHKCIPITIGYFQTKVSYFYMYVSIVAICIALTGIMITIL